MPAPVAAVTVRQCGEAHARSATVCAEIPDSGEIGRLRARGARRSSAPGVRVPHQNRSRPSTSTTRAAGTAAATSSRWRARNGYGSLGSTTSVGRERGHRGEVGLGIPVGARPRTGWPSRGARAPTRRRCRIAGSSTAGATRTRPRARAPSRAGGSDTSGASRPTARGERGDRRADVGDGARRHRVEREPGRDERVGVLAAVLLVVHHDEVGRERDDRGDVRDPSCRRRSAMPGCSQNRVHATGTTPSASSVSVADGTSETTRARRARHAGRAPTSGRAARPSSPRTPRW